MACTRVASTHHQEGSVVLRKLECMWMRWSVDIAVSLIPDRKCFTSWNEMESQQVCTCRGAWCCASLKCKWMQWSVERSFARRSSMLHVHIRRVATGTCPLLPPYRRSRRPSHNAASAGGMSAGTSAGEGDGEMLTRITPGTSACASTPSPVPVGIAAGNGGDGGVGVAGGSLAGVVGVGVGGAAGGSLMVVGIVVGLWLALGVWGPKGVGLVADQK